jgi:5'-nucleotidase
MVEGIKYNEIIKIGFLNNNIEENLEQYKKAYDVVILNDGSMNFVNKLLKQIK